MLTAGQRKSRLHVQNERFSRALWVQRLHSRTPMTVGIAAAVVYFLLGTAWAFSSPIFGVPDEYSHAVKAAAVVRGDILPTSASVGEWVTVPSWLASTSWRCFAGRGHVTADCQAPMTHTTLVTNQSTTAGRYPPFYYVLFGWPTLLFTGPTAFYMQREIVVFVTALLLGLAAWSGSAIPRGGRVMLALGVAITPMTIYFMGGVNPQAPEIAAAAGVWISGWALLQNHNHFDLGTIVRLTVSACALALCRPLSVVWLALIVSSLVIGFSRTSHWVEFRKGRAAKISAGAIFAACLVQTVWVASMGTLKQSTLGVHMSTADAIMESVSRQCWWLVQMIGQVGGFETISWWPVYVVWLVAGTCLVVTAVILGSRRERLALTLVIVGSMVIPTVAEVTTREQTGFAWQGRYTLPLAIGTILISGMIASKRFRSVADGRAWDRVARTMVVPMVGAAHFLAWGSALERYSVGASSDFPFGDYVVRWSPPGGVWSWTFVMGLSSGLFILWLLWATTSGPEDPPLDVVPEPSSGLSHRDQEVGQR